MNAQPPADEGRDLDLTGIAQRLRALNPAFSGIRVEAPSRAGAAVRVTIETTRAELASVNGQLHLTDPELKGLRIETAIRLLDQKPGERVKLQLRRTDPDAPQPRLVRRPKKPTDT